jgi:hypothetical protein
MTDIPVSVVHTYMKEFMSRTPAFQLVTRFVRDTAAVNPIGGQQGAAVLPKGVEPRKAGYHFL